MTLVILILPSTSRGQSDVEPVGGPIAIAYRAGTAMVALLRRHLEKPDDARALIRELFVVAGDIKLDTAANTLTVRIHRMASSVHDRAIAALLEELTRQEFQHPETGATMRFALV